MAAAQRNRFVLRNPEKADMNQYWYSPATIAAIAAEVDEHYGDGAALISTPSIFFSLGAEARAASKVLDFDRKWEADPGFVFYDFQDPTGVPEALHHTFSLVVIDPPFITREVWEQYATTARLLLKPGGKIIATTIQENAEMMEELLQVRPTAFMPSIPNLVYQYFLYTSYESERFSEPNPEIPV